MFGIGQKENIMSEPVPGDPQVDIDIRTNLLGALSDFDEDTANNLSFDLLGQLQQELGRCSGIVARYLAINLAKKLGGHIGASRSARDQQ